MELKEILEVIETRKPDEKAVEEAKKREEVLAKPTGALGDLEAMAIKMAGITKKVKNEIKKQCIVLFSSDNGVIEEGVASAPVSVTQSQTINFLRHYTGMSALANYFGCDMLIVDVGVKLPISDSLYTNTFDFIPGGFSETGEFKGKIVNRKIAEGTKNLAKEPAMTKEECIKAIMVGFDSVKAIKDAGYDIFGVGEMGIGNTTTSSCLLSYISKADPKTFIGRGGGLNDKGLKKKIDIVKNAVDKEKGDIIDALSHMGGFDIASMVGAYLGASYYEIPVVIDGYISSVAALIAKTLSKNTVNYMFSSHESKEPGYLIAIRLLELKPMFNLGMRLGEGSGCPIAFKILEAACAHMKDMATFSEGAIDAEYLKEGKEKKFF